MEEEADDVTEGVEMAAAEGSGTPDGTPVSDLAEEVWAVLRTLFPGGAVLNIPSDISEGVVAVMAYDGNDRRAAAELVGFLAHELQERGWAVAEEPSGVALYAAHRDIGGGVFAVEPPTASFHGIPDRDEEGNVPDRARDDGIPDRADENPGIPDQR